MRSARRLQTRRLRTRRLHIGGMLCRRAPLHPIALKPVAGLDLPDGHLRQDSHEEVVENLLKLVRMGEFTGKKPSKGAYSSMHPEVSDGHLLHAALLKEPLVIDHMAGGDAETDLTG